MSTDREKTWFGQPRGLTILFLTNMWELFSYYGMRTLLVYYMTKQLMFAQEKSSFIYGTYTAMAYFTPIIGGAIADRWLGKRRAVIIGASIMAVGHFMMTFEPLFYAALATIALGNGLFLPSLPSQINDLYRADDPRRGRAYNVYYVGLNIGGFMAPLICGTLGEVYGWHYGFGAAGIGMFVGLLIYVSGRRYLPEEIKRAPATLESAASAGNPREVWLLLLGVGLAATIFRGAYEQIGNTIPLWTD
ncbi:MAG: peptide MFS transporter, partial [Rhodanobacteraceae bacterium]